MTSIVEEQSKIAINLCLKNKTGDKHRVAVRFYDGVKEKYIITDYRILKADFFAKKLAPEVVDLKKELNDKIDACKKACAQQLTYERFRTVWDGGPLEAPITLMDLLDKHLELNSKNLLEHPPYKSGTVKQYQQYRKLLERIHNGVPEKNLKAKPLYCSQFTTIQAFKELENDTKTYAARGMGRTRVSMVMSRIKSICATGYNPNLDPKRLDRFYKCIPTDAYDWYSKPKEDEGTEPISFEDFNKILNYKPDLSTVNTDHKKYYREKSFEFGRDFWCFMVQAGGIEARDIALLRWSKVNETKGYFSYTRSKIEDDADGDTMISYIDYPHLQYVIEKYGLRGNKMSGGYVFPFLEEGTEMEKAIEAFYSRVTKIMGRLSTELGITPNATCKRARPTFACNAMENDVDIYTISKMMGHKSIKTTEIYLQKLPTKAKLKYSKEAASVYKKAA
jgi:integrase